MPEISLLKVGLAHGSLVLLTVLHAWHLNHQFFPTCIYLMRSNLSMVVLIRSHLFYYYCLGSCDIWHLCYDSSSQLSSTNPFRSTPPDRKRPSPRVRLDDHLRIIPCHDNLPERIRCQVCIYLCQSHHLQRVPLGGEGSGGLYGAGY